MLNAPNIRGSFKQIPYWKLRGYFRSCGYRDQEVAEAIGICYETLSARLNGHRPWTSKEIHDICEFLNIPQEKIGELFFPTLDKEEKTA